MAAVREQLVEPVERDVGSAAASLSGAEKRVLAALAGRPQGLLGEDSVSVGAGVPVSDTRRALVRLADLGLVACNVENDWGHQPPRQLTAWTIVLGDAWFRVAAEVRATPLPKLASAPLPEQIPYRFEYLFWWGDRSAIKLPRDAVFVAEHVLACHDIEAWGWVLEAFPQAALERVAAKERTPPQTRAMIRNALACHDGLSL